MPTGKVTYPIAKLIRFACKEYHKAYFRTPARETNGRSKKAARTDAGSCTGCRS